MPPASPDHSNLTTQHLTTASLSLSTTTPNTAAHLGRILLDRQPTPPKRRRIDPPTTKPTSANPAIASTQVNHNEGGWCPACGFPPSPTNHLAIESVRTAAQKRHDDRMIRSQAKKVRRSKRRKEEWGAPQKTQSPTISQRSVLAPKPEPHTRRIIPRKKVVVTCGHCMRVTRWQLPVKEARRAWQTTDAATEGVVCDATSRGLGPLAAGEKKSVATSASAKAKARAKARKRGTLATLLAEKRDGGKGSGGGGGASTGGLGLMDVLRRS